MKHLDTAKLEYALLPQGWLSFSDVSERIACTEDLKPERIRDILSGLQRVAAALDKPLSDVPADPGWLQPRLASVLPAALGISKKSWQNTVSNARAGMVHLGIVKKRFRRRTDLSPEWRQLWDALLASEDTTLPALCRFVHFLSGQGVWPAAVTDAHASAYHEAVALNEISKSPDTAFRAAVNSWNLAQGRIEGWPSIKLTLPYRRKRCSLPVETFPTSFIDDLEGLLDRLAHPDPLDDRGCQKTLRPQTLFHYRRQILRFAAELVHAGVPAEDIIDVGVLINPEMAEKGLRHMLAQNDGKTNRFIADTAGLLRNICRILDVAEPVHEKLSDIAKRLKVPAQKGMTHKNRTRLRILRDPDTHKRLLQLPEKLFANAERNRASHRAGLGCEDAIAIAILTYCPIRIKNLSGIHLEQNIQRPGDGRAYLVLEEDETKTGQSIEFEIPYQVLSLIDRHLKNRCPHMCPDGTTWLFPRRDGSAAVCPEQLSGRIRRRIRREAGIEMNAHLFRHFGVMLWLEANPGAYEAARRLLGHSDVSHTINLYSGLETVSAMAAFSDLVTSTKEALR